MTRLNEMDNYDLAMYMFHWEGAATYSWSNFTDEDKKFFYKLQAVIIDRFVTEQLHEYFDELDASLVEEEL